MVIKAIYPNDELWQKAIDYGKNCSWKAGYCTFVKKDCIPDDKYTPNIGCMFVGEQYRGKRLSEKMILTVIEYAKEIKFKEVYIATDHINLYDKYGFIKL
jgi:GNAT superfamily N-acetyltransferase